MLIASLQDLSGALVHLSGFLFVVFVLSLLWIVIEVIGAIFRKQGAGKSKAKPIVVAPAVASQTSNDGIAEEELVVIASTVALLLGHRPHRMVSIRTSSSGWSQEGRRQHLQSHRPHK